MPVLSKAQIEQFHQQGYLLIPEVYAPASLSAARISFAKLFSNLDLLRQPYNSKTLITDVYSHLPGLETVIFNATYAAIAHELLGQEAALIPECAIHRERYINWHADTTVQEIAGLKSHAVPGADPILQFATYFQGNTADGGGLTVIPGTHKDPDPFLNLYSEKLSHRIWNKLLKILRLSVFDALERHPQKTDIPMNPGDLLVFDVRVFHRATFRGQGDAPEKFAIFNTCVRPQGAGLDYFNFMKQRREPYYRYFREVPLPSSVRNRAEDLNLAILY